MKYLAIVFFLFCGNLMAQVNVRGVISDREGSNLPGASVVLLQKTDSVLQSFSITNNKGLFAFKKVPVGEYLLQVSFIGYADLSKRVTISGNQKDQDIGNIILEEDSKVLDGVSVNADRIPILIKEDTIEYNAAAFETKPNATVEELLKKLPGVEVESDGTIKAQGERVNKVLVDGKEFFGDDPKIATRNLSSDAVDKVQVFDKMSEMAEFTGIEDGNESKTINLTLKDDKKNGVFGKITGGYGTDQRHAAKINLNQFNENSRISFLGSSNNINEQNFSIQDYINFSGGISQLASGGGSINFSGQGFGQGNNAGINTNRSAGFNFNHDFKDKSELSASYLFGNSSLNLIRSSERQNFINDQIFNSSDSTQQQNNRYNHRLNLRLRKKINHMSDITFKSTLALSERNQESLNGRISLDAEGRLQNESSQVNDSDNNGYNINGSVLYRRRFEKKGRAFTADIAAGITQGDGRQNVSSNNLIYQDLILSEEIIINQNQNEVNEQTDYRTNLTYTEPLGKRKYLQFNYSRQNFDNELEKDFFDLLPDGSSSFNNALSTRYRRDYYYDRGGINLLSNFKKSTLNIGFKAQQSNLKGTLTDESVVINRNFFNILPSAWWQIDFAQSKSLTIDYNTSINQPTLEQLQPFVDNSNPLSVYTGNPDLKVEYKHNLRLNYLLFDNFSFTNLFFTLNSSITTNKITNETRIDDALRQNIRPVNIGKELLNTAYLSFGTPIRPLGIKVNLTYINSALKSQLFVNDIRNDLIRWTNSVDIKLENRKKKVF